MKKNRDWKWSGLALARDYMKQIHLEFLDHELEDFIPNSQTNISTELWEVVSSRLFYSNIWDGRNNKREVPEHTELKKK